MTPRHRQQPEPAAGAVRRAAATSVLSALALTSITITAAAVTLANGEPRPAPPAARTTTSADVGLLDPPVEVGDVPAGVPDIALVAADGPVLEDIPTAALAAYQRAEVVLSEADEACHLDWTLIAAVAQVVTGHGSTAGSALDARGVMRPRYAGKPLTGDRDRRVPDSDAGRLDGDARFDRPVGPMQLSPATWAVVGVDGDGDGKRNPHDIDDAALSVSVLLCSGEGDLSKRAGRVDGVRRINDGRTFIETVLAVDRAYRMQLAAGSDEPIVVPSQAPTYLPTDLPTNFPTDLRTSLPEAPDPPETGPSDPVTWTPEPPDPTDTPTDEPTETPTETPTDDPTEEPTDDPTDDPCLTDVPDETDPTDPSEPTDLPTATEPLEPLEPTDTATAEPTDDETDLPTDPGCPTPTPESDETD
ncbi:hypothetical protein D0Z08_08000 [Nocardioides immobilis]|uniref:Transglycosylase SLT domain-containing protein n=1 Tax=Nocardioides immobilis TaxID=2049295 RepID=A0A417Y4K8_9ACTN|nr:hypothetical protein [Nocardioides immobilis]RHW27612.1 hypothetical protein D0Z08_08000 [Nocardioides immobilis]